MRTRCASRAKRGQSTRRKCAGIDLRPAAGAWPRPPVDAHPANCRRQPSGTACATRGPAESAPDHRSRPTVPALPGAPRDHLGRARLAPPVGGKAREANAPHSGAGPLEEVRRRQGGPEGSVESTVESHSSSRLSNRASRNDAVPCARVKPDRTRPELAGRKGSLAVTPEPASSRLPDRNVRSCDVPPLRRAIVDSIVPQLFLHRVDGRSGHKKPCGWGGTDQEATRFPRHSPKLTLA
jgi:hypothetical protein